MKKIGVLTYHRSYNYGAFMQCYALINRIKNDFPNVSVEVIDYTTRYTMEVYENWLSTRRSDVLNKLTERNELFKKAQEKYLPLSKYSLISNNYQELFINIKGKYDVIIVGSDAVWNWNGKGLPNAYFLGEDLEAKKMSYAASSHGVDYSKMTVEQKEQLKGYLKDFSYLGVREFNTEKMIKSIDENLEVFQNCDPTALLEVEKISVNIDKLKEKLQRKGIDFNKPVIGIMAGEHIGKEIRKYFKGKAQIVAVFEPNKYADFYLHDLCPLEWARVFSLFDITITHFFHGTMLSLRNLTPVISIEVVSAYSSKYTTKIENVINNLGLDELYETWDNFNLNVFQKVLSKLGLRSDKIFWNRICKKIEQVMATPLKEKIRLSLEKESNKYNTFKLALENIVKE